MDEVKADFRHLGYEYQASYLNQSGGNELCPAQIWQLRNSAAHYRPPLAPGEGENCCGGKGDYMRYSPMNWLAGVSIGRWVNFADDPATHMAEHSASMTGSSPTSQTVQHQAGCKNGSVKIDPQLRLARSMAQRRRAQFSKTRRRQFG